MGSFYLEHESSIKTNVFYLTRIFSSLMTVGSLSDDDVNKLYDNTRNRSYILLSRHEIYFSVGYWFSCRLHLRQVISYDDRRRVCVTLTWNSFISMCALCERFYRTALPQKATTRLNTTHCTYCLAAESRPFLVAGRREDPPGPRVSPASSAAGPRSRGIPGGPRTKICCPRVFPPAGPPRPPLAPSCQSKTKTMPIRTI